MWLIEGYAKSGGMKRGGEEIANVRFLRTSITRKYYSIYVFVLYFYYSSIDTGSLSSDALTQYV